MENEIELSDREYFQMMTDEAFDDFNDDFEPTIEMIAKARMETFNFLEELENIYESCIITVLKQAIMQNSVLLFSSFLYQCMFRIHFALPLSPTSRHKLLCAISLICSMISLKNIFSDILYLTLGVMLALSMLVYILINFTSSKYTALLAVLFIVTGELLLQDTWNRLRGVVLLLSMRVISYSFDCERYGIDINFVEYLTYAFYPGTIVFGPWVSLSDHLNSLKQPIPLSFNWIASLLKNMFLAMLCLVTSTCFASYLFLSPDNPYMPALIPLVSEKWMQAYSTALSFHFSHYYICYLSILTLQLSGCGYAKPIKKLVSGKLVQNNDHYNWYSYTVVSPLVVEFPRSMSLVAVAWNVPISQWLKNYVFKTFRRFGVFPAIVCVYVASSLLHGISVHLSLVLLSLAVYTYVEEIFRAKVAARFNCPHVKARSNEPGEVSLMTRIFNLMWVAINIMHLSYLGSLFDNDISIHNSFAHTFSKWSELKFASHLIVAVCYLGSLLL